MAKIRRIAAFDAVHGQGHENRQKNILVCHEQRVQVTSEGVRAGVGHHGYKLAYALLAKKFLPPLEPGILRRLFTLAR